MLSSSDTGRGIIFCIIKRFESGVVTSSGLMNSATWASLFLLVEMECLDLECGCCVRIFVCCQ